MSLRSSCPEGACGRAAHWPDRRTHPDPRPDHPLPSGLKPPHTTRPAPGTDPPPESSRHPRQSRLKREPLSALTGTRRRPCGRYRAKSKGGARESFASALGTRRLPNRPCGYCRWSWAGVGADSSARLLCGPKRKRADRPRGLPRFVPCGRARCGFETLAPQQSKDAPSDARGCGAGPVSSIAIGRLPCRLMAAMMFVAA
jgi:hypothetical protein